MLDTTNLSFEHYNNHSHLHTGDLVLELAFLGKLIQRGSEKDASKV
jgi:hypothetical protein